MGKSNTSEFISLLHKKKAFYSHLYYFEVMKHFLKWEILSSVVLE